jgi:hypothetical protein
MRVDYSKDIHYVPVDDLFVHYNHRGCPCKPRTEGNTVIHLHYDGRPHEDQRHDKVNCGTCNPNQEPTLADPEF